MAWGVEGFVVSFIAPHSLTARALVVAPGDALTVHNRSRDEPVDVSTSTGARSCELGPGRGARARASRTTRRCSRSSRARRFYQRLREKFGRLAS